MANYFTWLMRMSTYLLTPMALTPDVKDKLQQDMVERLGAPVAVINNCDSFEYLSTQS